MKLTIIIVNYNVRDYLHQCLLSVEKSAEGIDAEVYVVDNASSDGSVDYLRSLHPEVHFIENKDNVGFARANNMAIRRSTGEYVLLLNPDTLLTERTLSESVAFMDAHPEAGGLGVKMLKADGTFALESRRGVPTPFTAFCKMSGLASLLPYSRTFGRYYMRYLDVDEANEIEIISGAYMFLRRNALNESGYLDEDFFMYGEDIDLSYRLLKRDWKNYYLPTPILHYKGESTEKSTYRYIHNFYKAMLIFFSKNFGYYSLIYSLPIRAAILVKGTLAYLQMWTLKKFGKKKTHLDYLRTRRYLFVGNETDFQAARTIMAHSGIDLEYGGDAPHGHAQLEGTYRTLQPHWVVYNAEQHSYGELLSFFQQSAPMALHPGIALYYPSTHSIITDKYVFET